MHRERRAAGGLPEEEEDGGEGGGVLGRYAEGGPALAGAGEERIGRVVSKPPREESGDDRRHQLDGPLSGVVERRAFLLVDFQERRRRGGGIEGEL